MNQTVLITGGAGYVGSHTVLACRARGMDVVVLDNLSTGSRRLIPDDVSLIEGDIGDKDLLQRIFQRYSIAAIIHFAGDIVVPESVRVPLQYYRNNTCKTRLLLEMAVEHSVRSFVFSSTAAVYGEPEKTPVAEQAPTNPISPYGTSKLMSEWMLRDASAAHDFRYVALRYFNVAGADPDGRAGQATPNATHLIKIASEVAVGKRPHIEIYGEDYNTPDGTCIRDFIHVSDLAEAHVSALDYLDSGGDSIVLNCGYGHGYSVRQVLEAVERSAGKPLDIRPAPRRSGDVVCLIADASALRQRFSWAPRHDDIDEIVQTALRWEQAVFNGK